MRALGLGGAETSRGVEHGHGANQQGSPRGTSLVRNSPLSSAVGSLVAAGLAMGSGVAFGT
jgi:hypothetical protein